MQHSYSVLRCWKWELLAITFAIGIIAVMISILMIYDGKPAPEWGMRLNLNALLALLSTILRALLVVIISQVISQQKWEWFSNKSTKPLSDMQKFDSGSRGISGALLLIPTVIIKDPVTLIAAVVLVVSFLIGPFVQQASCTTPCLLPAPGLNASLPYAHYVPRRGGLSLQNMGGIDRHVVFKKNPIPDTAMAILSSIIAPNGTGNQIRGTCATGTCTFSNSDPEDNVDTYPTDESLSTHSTVAMCDRCIDVTSLVSRTLSSTRFAVHFELPSGLNLSYSAASAFAVMGPSAHLWWLGDLLTPELQTMSRWAYVNATFLTLSSQNAGPDDIHAEAAVCILYPCLRTYTASITNNQLAEKEVSSQVMNPSEKLEEYVPSSLVAEYKGFSLGSVNSYNAAEQDMWDYVAIKSPCHFGGQVYDIDVNTTVPPNATSLVLYDFTDSRRITYRNISAPEPCIYRQDVGFVKAISTTLNEEIFDGSCSFYRPIECGKSGGKNSVLADFGAKKVLEKLIEGQRGYANVTSWFSRFANAMTSQFRIEYGAAAFDTSFPRSSVQNVTLGQVQGIAWQTESCVSAQTAWLILPLCLTGITVLLMVATMASNWRYRGTRPAWKDNILPLLFYRNKIEPGNPGALPWNRVNGIETDGKDRLMEASEMENISKEIPVMFQWSVRGNLQDSLNEADIAAIALGKLPTQRGSREGEAESLLPTADTQKLPLRDKSNPWWHKICAKLAACRFLLGYLVLK